MLFVRFTSRLRAHIARERRDENRYSTQWNQESSGTEYGDKKALPQKRYEEMRRQPYNQQRAKQPVLCSLFWGDRNKVSPHRGHLWQISVSRLTGHGSKFTYCNWQIPKAASPQIHRFGWWPITESSLRVLFAAIIPLSPAQHWSTVLPSLPSAYYRSIVLLFHCNGLLTNLTSTQKWPCGYYESPEERPY